MKIVAAALLAAVWPPLSLAITEHLLRTTMRQFTEPREKDVYKWQTCLDYLSAHAA
jgi:hypothetical protein